MKLIEKIQTKEDFDRMSKILSERVKYGQSISENAMLDGMIIGFILTTDFTLDVFLGEDLGRVLDGTMQKLEQIVIWTLNNKNIINKLL